MLTCALLYYSMHACLCPTVLQHACLPVPYCTTACILACALLYYSMHACLCPTVLQHACLPVPYCTTACMLACALLYYSMHACLCPTVLQYACLPVPYSIHLSSLFTYPGWHFQDFVRRGPDNGGSTVIWLCRQIRQELMQLAHSEQNL